MYQVIDYYEPAEEKGDLQYSQGSVWWACLPYTFDKPIVTRFYFDRPIERLDLTTFEANKEVVDKKSNTNPGEFLALSKFKKRPVVILSTPGSPYGDRAWHGGEYFVVAPLRSLRVDVTGEYKANPDFVWGAVTYHYNSIFYLPDDPKFDLRESVVQFDRLTTLHVSWLLEAAKAKLTRDAWICLSSWLQNYLFGRIPKTFNENLNAYREMVGEDPKVKASMFGKKGM